VAETGRGGGAVSEITQKYTIPTGYLFVGEYEKGPLETLSIGDYGKRYNVKANFLGYHDEIKGVPNVHCMPLSEKWVITISTQHGCVMKCTFCDVPNVKWRGNATFEELKAQLYNAIGLFPECNYTERLNIHFARMGEPIFNEAVFEFSRWLIANKRQIASDTGLRIEVLHPVLTTSSPRKFAKLEARILEWCEIKNDLYNGQAGLQFSINSTSDEQRSAMYTDMQIYLDDLAKIAEKMPEPISRKYCLNFAFATGNECDGKKMAAWFDPAKFMCKITPIHNNNACREHGIETVGGYSSYEPYQEAEQALLDAGFDVLTFVPSLDEEDGLVTCGNVILGGSTLKYDEGLIKIEGLRRSA
jgi:23S rRNA (adenine2503-C2)-methyltransferase